MSKSTGQSQVVFFYGAECTWCHKTIPHIEEAEKITGVKIKRVETWHNEANAKLLQEADSGKCGGVPFIINKKTGKWLCGFSETDAIVALIKGDGTSN